MPGSAGVGGSHVRTRIRHGCDLFARGRALVVVPVAASAAPEITWTKITTPSTTFTYHVGSATGAANHLTVSGQARVPISRA